MAIRRLKKPGGPVLTTGNPVLVETQTTNLVEVSDLSEVGTAEVKGAFVKLAPKIRASERESFDGEVYTRELLKRGAVAVVLAPTVIPDVKRVVAEKVAKAVTNTEAVDLWFAEQTGVPKDVLDAARELVLAAMAEAGL